MKVVMNRQIGVEESKDGVTGNPLFAGREGVTWPTFRILGPLHISETVEARNFKFDMHIDYQGAGALTKICKNRSKEVGKGSRGVLLKCLDPLHISGTVRARKFKFGIQSGHQGFLRKKIKIRSKGDDLLFEFWNPSYL